MPVLPGRHELADFLQGLQRARTVNAVGMKVDRIQIGLGCTHVAHDIDALGAIPIADLGDDGDPGVLLHHVIEAATAQLRHVLGQVAGDLQHLALGRAIARRQERHGRLGGLFARQIVVRQHRHVDLAARGRTVDGIERDACVFRRLHRKANAGAVIGHRHDGRNALRNAVIDIVQLFLRIAARGRGQNLPSLGLRRSHQPGLDLRLRANQTRCRIADHHLVLRQRRQDHHRSEQDGQQQTASCNSHVLSP